MQLDVCFQLGVVVDSVDKTTDSWLWCPLLESTGCGSSTLEQGTLSSLPSPSDRILKPLVPWLLAYEHVAFLVAR